MASTGISNRMVCSQGPDDDVDLAGRQGVTCTFFVQPKQRQKVHKSLLMKRSERR